MMERRQLEEEAILYQEAIAAFEATDYVRAEQRITAALEQDPDEPRYLALAVFIFEKAGKLERALDTASRFRSVDPPRDQTFRGVLAAEARCRSKTTAAPAVEGDSTSP